MWDPIKTTDIAWNFEKFIIDRNGIPRYRFHPTAWNSGEFVMPYIQELLNETHKNYNDSNRPLHISLRQVNQYQNNGGAGPLMGYNQEYGPQAQNQFNPQPAPVQSKQ